MFYVFDECFYWAKASASAFMVDALVSFSVFLVLDAECGCRALGKEVCKRVR